MNSLKENRVDNLGDVISAKKNTKGRFIELTCQHGKLIAGFSNTIDGEIESYLEVEKFQSTKKTGLQLKDIDVYTLGVDITLSNNKKVFIHAEETDEDYKYEYQIALK